MIPCPTLSSEDIENGQSLLSHIVKGRIDPSLHYSTLDIIKPHHLLERLEPTLKDLRIRIVDCCVCGNLTH